MASTLHLDLPLIAASQAQKHVTHNEALVALDAVVQLAVIDRDLAAPPGGAADGDRYVVGPAATGAWTGKEDMIAILVDGGWRFHAPKAGWVAWVEDEAVFCRWTGSAWTPLLPPSGGRRNAFINPFFEVAQAYSAPFALSSGPLAIDMVRGSAAPGGAWTVSLEPFAQGQTDVPGNPARFLRIAQDTAPSSGFAGLWFVLGDVSTLAGRQVTASFHARVQSGELAMGRGFVQNFGSGGMTTDFGASSPVLGGFTLSTDWQRFAVTTTIKSLAGKTIGPGNYAVFRVLAAAAGADFHLDICGVQVEEGPIATDLAEASKAEAESLCRHYFETVDIRALNGTQWISCQPKRATPTVSTDVGSVANPRRNGCQHVHGADAAATITFDARL